MWLQKKLIALIGCVTVVWLFLFHEYQNHFYFRSIDDPTRSSINETLSVPTKHSIFSYTMRPTDTSKYSILGKWLHAPEGTEPPSPQRLPGEKEGERKGKGKPNEPGKRFKILMWKHGEFLHQRHVLNYNTNASGVFSPWKGCSVVCALSYRDADLATADAVIFHMHKTRERSDIPRIRGKIGQIWIFLTDESPLHTFMYPEKNKDISQYDETFDWSMSYKWNSDIPVPYGRTVLRKVESKMKLEKRYGEKKNLVAIMGSHCGSTNNERWKYAKELKFSLGDKMDVYGKCLNGNATACPGHFRRDCPVLGNYKFYLAFENCNCHEYMTEKLFWNAYEKKSVPIIMGAPRTDCLRLLPPKSYLHVDDFASPSSLAEYILNLDKHDDDYNQYHQWRSTYRVINEHGYFGSKSIHYCRVCEALYYNDPPSTNTPKYRRLRDFLNPHKDCNT